MEAYNEWPVALQNVLIPWVPSFAQLALWITVALTAISGLIYLFPNRELFLCDL